MRAGQRRRGTQESRQQWSMSLRLPNDVVGDETWQSGIEEKPEPVSMARRTLRRSTLPKVLSTCPADVETSVCTDADHSADSAVTNLMTVTAVKLSASLPSWQSVYAEKLP